MPDIGPRLRAAREARGLTTREAAELAGTSHGNLIAVEMGRRTATLQWVYDYATAIGADPHAVDERLAPQKGRRR